MTITTDPVCGIARSKTGAAVKSYYREDTYLFCCSHCKAKFDFQPEQYLGLKSKPGSAGGCGCGCGPSS